MKALLLSATLLALAPTHALAQMHLADQIKVGGTGGWDYATFDAATRKMYIAHATGIAVIDVDAKTGAPAQYSAEGAHIAIAYDGGKSLMVTNGKSNTVTLIDTASGAVTATLPTEAKPDGGTIEPKTGHGFVMANGGTTVDVVDLQAKTIIGKIKVPGAPEGAGFDGNGRVFTHLEDKNVLVVIDAASMKVKASFAMKDCDSPSGLAYITGRDWVLSACDNHIARVTDATTGREIARLPIGDEPDFALYDSARKIGYIPAGEGKLTAISFAGKTPKVIAQIGTQAGARTAALDPKTGDVLLPTADFGPVDATTKRPSILPDTFRVLIVSK